jgi:hypothetical protein
MPFILCCPGQNRQLLYDCDKKQFPAAATITKMAAYNGLNRLIILFTREIDDHLKYI